MTFYRSKADQIIDRAHNAIATAEMLVSHAFTPKAKEDALYELANAQDFLRRACEAKRAWQAADHDEYEQYPDVPETAVVIDY
jgi:hypothetical protein